MRICCGWASPGSGPASCAPPAQATPTTAGSVSALPSTARRAWAGPLSMVWPACVVAVCSTPSSLCSGIPLHSSGVAHTLV